MPIDLNNFNVEDEDTRSELKFDIASETPVEKEKRARIENALQNDKSNLKVWQKLAIEEYGLVNDDLRRKIWPLLLGVDPDPSEPAPSLSDLSHHAEYDQVVLDVNRSLKRFPPGIPYKQRLALQDQLTVLILRVIMKYPHLRYYQGYHDVAITFLLVVGETVAFRIMEVLSTTHLRECMEPTMEKTSYRLNFLYPLLQREDKKLHDFLESAMVGTMFALPWYLTWFGHSLNQYRDVVRLYDYFLASPPLMPLYTAASLVLYRKDKIYEAGCDMANIHCLLSQIPDNIDFEEVLRCSTRLFEKHPPHKLEKDVNKRVKREKEQLRRKARAPSSWLVFRNYIPNWLLLHYRGKVGLFIATATVLFGLYAYLNMSESGPLFYK
ncbi:TBC1 domain family member 20 isoform X2 [Agrilus planipennis]|nr:TBC1 domain family member 20 isoform X2 [Agrilus planipennis]